MSTVNSGFYDHLYKGETIQVHWQLQKYGNNSYTERIEFEYKDVRVYCFYDGDEKEWYNIVNFHCSVINKIGSNKYSEFKKIYDEFETLIENNITLEEKVYSYIYNKMPLGSNLNYHIMRISMKDGKIIDGSPSYNQNGIRIENKEEYNRDKTYKNLRNRVEGYYKAKSILPSEEFINQELTNKYEKALKYFRDNGIDL